MTAAAIDLLRREIANPDTQWSLGTFGAIAEFSRDRDEPVRLVQSDRCRFGGDVARRHCHQVSSRQPAVRVREHHQNRLEPAGRALPAGR